ncbi:hypothetical protein BTA51_10740 [Hahella sp. CCB-MM4]|uniref:DUF58 domain-containing protein n=1 Tax=Hahella sp. (strain CCB-MM4) TaxID=1926491 RepID=UPI000B9A8CAD|nr:DUF58 domain-containing protein [Hahella sp. CCB-MM4]OZG73485.1 hypothetical protein BTA51_10740 [Hahella sp. CCB-MM4]
MVSVIQQFEKRVSFWVERRIPPVNQVELSHREIFILPTRWGVLFLGLIGLLILTGINYQNSMILAVGFFLFSILLLNIVSAYRNISGLYIKFHHSEPCFAGDLGGLEFVVAAREKNHSSIEIGWVPESFNTVDIEKGQSVRFIIELPCPERGRYRPGRMLITSVFPMGLIRAWSWQDLKAEIIVYPKPLESQMVWGQAEGDQQSGKKAMIPGQEDFEGLRSYVPGESLNRVAWKKYAQSGEFYSKEFAQPLTDPEWIDFSAYSVGDTEIRLAMMCHQVLAMNAKRQLYGVRLPGKVIAPDLSELHKNQCLSALALYPEG